MQQSQTKIALWGFGAMNKIILSYLRDSGYQVVTVIGHHDHGQDAGVVAGLEPIGVSISRPQEAREVLLQQKPALGILATKSFLKDLEQPLRIMAECQLNVITIGEEAFYSWNTDQALTQEIDALFRKNGVTLTGTGYQDAYWLYLASILVGVSLKVDRLVCSTQFNVDDYGTALCKESLGVGLSPAQFAEKFTPENSVPAFVWNSNEALAVRLGWKILKTTQVYEPLILTKDIHCKTLNVDLKSGQVNGLKAVVITQCQTKQGKIIEIETNQIGQVYYDDLEDYCHWQTHGTPSLELSCKKPDTVALTCTSAVNRIPGVISARPGYVTVNELGPLA